MRPLHVFGFVVLAGLAGFIGSRLMPAESSAPTAKTETAYERVMTSGTIRCGYLLWPVLAERDPATGSMSGYSVEIFEKMAQQLGWKVEWAQEVMWGQQVTTLDAGKIDAICTGDGPIVHSMAGRVMYTQPLAYMGFYIYGREDDRRFLNATQMNNKSVKLSVMDGDISMTVAIDQFPDALRLELPQTAEPSMLMMNVAQGKADAVVMDPGSIVAFNNGNQQKLSKLVPTPVAGSILSYTVRMGAHDLLAALNQSLELAFNMGHVDRILDKYDPTRTSVVRVPQAMR